MIKTALPIFLQSIDWSNPFMLKEGRKMLSLWAPMDP